ncbi:MAG: PLP-dependent aspartate aminotransferase family protein [Pseudomonadota bacterium]
MADQDTHPETQIAQGLGAIDRATGGVMPAIQPSSTYARDRDYALFNAAHSYSRDQNPTYAAAEAMLKALEQADDARLFASGMAAATAVFRTLKPGDHVVAPALMYWGLRAWLVRFCDQWQVSLSLFDPEDPEALAQAVRPGETRVVWIETPTNPTWSVIDIAAAATIAHTAGAVLAVDSTVATPVHTRPLTLGADIVMHSATKALNGHSDVLAGVLACQDASSAMWQAILTERGESGAIPGPFEAWLLQRGLRTLFLRVERASATALSLAEALQAHPAVSGVYYPGLPSHPGHDIARRQMQGGFGGLLSFTVTGGGAAALQVAGALTLFLRATSLGGVESLVEHRATIEGPDSPIPPELLRLSVGIERAEDLWADLERALDTLVVSGKGKSE